LSGRIAGVCASRPIYAEPASFCSNRRDLEPMARRAGVPFSVIPWNNRASAEDRALDCWTITKSISSSSRGS